jgi:hypothetical protein
MAIGARVELELADAETTGEACDAFIGSAGPETRRDHASIVRRKFLATGGSAEVLAELERIESLDQARTARVLLRALSADPADTATAGRTRPGR